VLVGRGGAWPGGPWLRSCPAARARARARGRGRPGGRAHGALAVGVVAVLVLAVAGRGPQWRRPGPPLVSWLARCSCSRSAWRAVAEELPAPLALLPGLLAVLVVTWWPAVARPGPPVVRCWPGGRAAGRQACPAWRAWSSWSAWRAVAEELPGRSCLVPLRACRACWRPRLVLVLAVGLALVFAVGRPRRAARGPRSGPGGRARAAPRLPLPGWPGGHARAPRPRSCPARCSRSRSAWRCWCRRVPAAAAGARPGGPGGRGTARRGGYGRPVAGGRGAARARAGAAARPVAVRADRVRAAIRPE